jgi:hypothetical protein
MRHQPTFLLVLALAAPTLRAQAAHLGGSLDGFTSKWGQPFRTTTGSIYDFEKCPGRTDIARWSIIIEDGRVTVITRIACPGETLDPVESAREAATFSPPDASKPLPFRTSDGWAAEQRRSASLAKQLPASVFNGCTGVSRPGTFSYVLSPDRRSWTLAIGNCL